MVNKIDFLHQFIDSALQEDVGDGDHTSLACIDPNSRSRAHLKVKDVGVIAGVEFAEIVMHKIDPTSQFKLFIPDGNDVSEKDIVFELEANTQKLLLAERIILNVVQRMSGIATLASIFKAEVENIDVTILDTRKTTPLFRFIEKWAVRIGGCVNYRNGLYDWIMIKDNHIKACGGIGPAIQQVHKYLEENKLDLGITIEVKNLVEVYEVLEEGGVTRIMFDNFELPLLKEAVHIVNGKFETEASGGINLYTVRNIALTGVDFISSGALTHSAGILDLSLKIID